MELSLVRIDDRLVHGQVVMGWVPFLKAQLVLVVSDEAAQDETLVALMQMALPDDVELKVLGVEDAARFLRESPGEPRRLLVLAPGPQEVLRLIEAGASISSVNVGGLHYTAGRVQLGKAIFLSEDDRAALSSMSRRGVTLEGRALPGDPPLDIVELISSGSAH